MCSSSLISARSDRYVLPVIGLLLLAGVAIRAALMPLVHDEAASLFWYVDRNEFLPYLSLWDANNHYLNSAFGIFVTKLFGEHLLSIRLLSVLAYSGFIWAAYRCVLTINGSLIRWCVLVALVLCPFVIDLFSLFRGYGPMLAFWMLALERMVAFERSGDRRTIFWMWVFILLANASVLTILPVSLLLFVSVLKPMLRSSSNEMAKWSRFGIAIMAASGLSIGLLLSWELKRRGLLYHGSTEGLIKVTVMPLVELLFGSDDRWSVGIVMLAGGMAAISAIRSSSWSRKVCGTLFLGDLLLRIPAAIFFDVNYPEDRAAVHLVPLFILLVGWMLDGTDRSFIKVRSVALVLLILPLRSLLSIDPLHTSLWPEQAVPVEWLRTISDEQKKLSRPLVLGTYHQLQLNVPYLARIHGIDLPLAETEDFPHAPADMYIVDHRYRDHFMDDEILLENEHLSLVRRPLDLELIAEHRPEMQGSAAIFEMLNERQLSDAKGAFLEISCIIDCSERLADIHFIVLHGDEPVPKYENGRSPRLIRPYWHNERSVVMKWMGPQIVKPHLVLWDPLSVQCDVDELRIRVYRPRPTRGH